LKKIAWPLLTGLSCDHVLVVCSFRKFDPSEYINSYYSLESFFNTWYGVFNSYRNLRDWQMFHGATIGPDLKKKINKSRRRKIRNLMVIDEIEDQVSKLSGREIVQSRKR
jgi:hypothetical protein